MPKTVLERVIATEMTLEEMPSVLEMLSFEEPDTTFNIGIKAVKLLENPDEIKQFMDDYTAEIVRREKVSLQRAREVAEDIVGYCTGYVNDDRANKWFNALPTISHPVTGRERPFFKDKKVNYYVVIGRTRDPEIIACLTRKLTEEFSMAGVGPRFEVQTREGRDNKGYFGIELTAKENGIFTQPKDVFLFLTGYVKGLNMRIQDEIGKTCPLVVETI